ncbi:MAG TPA: hypothetical protein VG297_15795 [Bryobacteraceae bacterium]|nr:hypothetical protein [Bryobacteraceae bacterium]
MTGLACADTFLVDVDNVTIEAPGGQVALNFAIAGATPPANFNVIASSFSGDQGLIDVNITNQSCGPGVTAGPSATLTPSSSRVATACLVVKGLMPGAKYTGTLVVSAGTAEFHKLTINAVAATTPTLALDHQAETKQITKPLWAVLGISYETPVDSVVIVEKSGKSSASGISVRLDSTAKSPSGFNDKRNLAFGTQGKPIDDFLQTPAGPDASRTVNPGGHAQFDISARNLAAGEYTIPLRFSGTNTGPDTPQTLLTLTVRVRDSIFAAIFWLFVALISSFVVTKLLTGLQRGAAMRQQIRDMEKMRGADISYSPAAVWVNAMLHLAGKLSSRFWLTGADLIDARISKTRAMIDLLNQITDLRASLSSKLSGMARWRALQALDVLLSGIDPTTTDAAKIEGVKAQLAAFNDWIRSETLPKVFWTTIAPALQELQRQTAAWGDITGEAKALVDGLVANLKNALATQAPPPADVEQVYSDYARLKLLYDHRDDPAVFDQLRQSQQDLDQCFHIADKADWDRLEKSKLSIEMPRNTNGDDLEAYDPLSFSVTSDDPRAAHSFLFRQRVEFAWKFTLTRGGTTVAGQAVHPVTLEPKAFGPWVMQYFPRPGQVNVNVTLTYDGKTVKPDPAPGPVIHDTSDFGTFRAFAKSDYIAWGFAAVVALVTGLSTIYFKNATFGSMQDYILLFLWGVGADQGKNLTQALQAYTPSSPAPGPASKPAT